MFGKKDKLTVKGNDIVNRAGQKIRLRGTNLGGWLMREGWMDGGGSCRMPLETRTLKQSGQEVIWDLVKKRSWNRVECYDEELNGDFLIEISDDMKRWQVFQKGSFGNRRLPAVDEDRPAPYVLYKNPHDDGCFFWNGTVHTNEIKSRFIRFTAQRIPLDVKPAYYGDMDEYTSRRILKDRFGEKEAETLLQIYQDAYIQDQDIRLIKSLGMNFVRVPVYWQVIMTPDGNIKENAWKSLDWLVEKCDEAELYVMLDFHGAPGGQTGGSLTCGQIGANELWSNSVYQEMSEKILEAITERYSGHPCVCMIDLLNEPLPVYNEELPKSSENKGSVITDDYIVKLERMLDRLYQAVRRISEEMIVSINLFYDYHILKAPGFYGWSNVIYQTHTYGLGDWKNPEAMIKLVDDELRELRELQTYWQVPVLSGESNFWGHWEVWRKWLTQLNRMNIHWATWTYKNIDPVQQNTWGILYDFGEKLPDYYRDDYEVLKVKLQAFDSNHYRMNQKFAKLLKEMTEQDRNFTNNFTGRHGL